MGADYHFFPWVRRGLAAALPPTADPLPARGLAEVKITVTAELVGARTVRLYGPGDVLGIDERLIVRTEPRPATMDFEPNYLAAIDFDAPELPWVFTPTGAAADGKLRPWLVLVVVDADLIALPKAARRQPLPSITLAGALARTELPELADSWAWAHGQRLVAPGDSGDASAELLATPNLNVSRLVAPRRLAPNRRWMACLVPAFDAGVATGLGVPRPDPNAPLQPAWKTDQQDLQLPVYYHWEFQTGTAGDFEFLARRLKPVVATAAVDPGAARRARAALGESGGVMETVRIEAPLEMIDQPLATAAGIPPGFAADVEQALTPAGPDSPELLPPIYGDRLARRFAIHAADAGTKWLDELNLDPRTRLAASGGGDTVRKNQEELMQFAWAQVGDVLKANAQIARSRFALLVAERALERHVLPLPPVRLLALAAPLLARLRTTETTVAAQLSASSLADAAFDPALRRLCNPSSRLSRRLARLGQPGTLAHGVPQALQRSAEAADPTLVLRDGVRGLALAAAADRSTPPGTPWTGGPAAGAVVFDRAALARQSSDSRLSLTPRTDLDTTGFLGSAHLRAATQVSVEEGVPLRRVLEQMRAAAVVSPSAVQLAVLQKTDASAFSLVAIERAANDTLTMVEPSTRARTPLLKVTSGTGIDPALLLAVLRRVPKVVLAPGAHEATVQVTRGVPQVTVQLRRSATVPGGTPPRSVQVPPERDLRANEQLFSHFLPAPLRETSAVAALKGALRQLAQVQPAAEANLHFRPAALGGAALELPDQARTALQPSATFRRRLAGLIATPDWLKRAEILDPILAAPVLDMPFGELYAQVAPERFLPLDLNLPSEAITALSTNPRFIAAYLAGANHEWNRELLWRTYPTDARGTSIRRFWDWTDPNTVDVHDLHAWPEPGPLAARLSSGTPKVVLAIRGRLLRRYPNTILLIWKAAAVGKLEAVDESTPELRRKTLREPLFHLWLEPDVALVGFDIAPEELTSDPAPGWYVVLQEPLTEPRFGLDEPGTPASGGRSRNDGNWSATGVSAGGYLTAGNPALAPHAHSAEFAMALLQRPVRVAIQGSLIAPAFPKP